ncbi:MAG TPA: hemolysin III family protein [Azospira sp.]|nr:hemolysin III family protein [Azospira sp.]
MQVPVAGLDRRQSRAEEMANSMSHGAGFAAALVGAPFLVIQAQQRGQAGFLVGTIVFAVAMVFLYLSSTLYHAMPAGRAKRVFRLIDHAAIFLLIAGTYTPFTLGVLSGGWGWSLLAIVWSLAILGIALKAFDRASNPFFSTGLYLLMGWVVVLALDPLLARMPPAGLYLLLAGGLSYTAGVAFFATDSRLRYGHFIWHLFVLMGTVCHYFAVLWYAA